MWYMLRKRAGTLGTGRCPSVENVPMALTDNSLPPAEGTSTADSFQSVEHIGYRPEDWTPDVDSAPVVVMQRFRCQRAAFQKPSEPGVISGR